METYNRLRFYLKVPTFPLKLYYIDVNKEAELMFLLGYSHSCQRKYVQVVENVPNVPMIATNKRSTQSNEGIMNQYLLQLQIVEEEAILARSFYQFISLENNLEDICRFKGLSNDELFFQLKNYIFDLSISRKRVFKQIRFQVEMWFKEVRKQLLISHKNRNNLETSDNIAPTTELSIPKPALVYRDEALCVFPEPQNLYKIITFCNHEFLSGFIRSESINLSIQFDDTIELIQNLLSNAQNFLRPKNSSSFPLNILFLAFYKSWKYYILKNIFQFPDIITMNSNNNNKENYKKRKNDEILRSPVVESGASILLSSGMILWSFSGTSTSSSTSSPSFTFNISKYLIQFVELINQCLDILNGNITPEDNLLNSFEQFHLFYKLLISSSSPSSSSSSSKANKQNSMDDTQRKDWKDDIEFILKISCQSYLMVFFMLQSEEERDTLFTKDVHGCLIRILHDTYSLELHLWVMSIIEVLSNRNHPGTIMESLIMRTDEYDLGKILSKSMTISRITFEDIRQNSSNHSKKKLNQVIISLNDKICKFISKVSLLSSKKLLNKLLNSGLITDIISGMQLFSCFCLGIQKRNILIRPTYKQLSSLTSTEGKTKKLPRYLTPSEVSLNPPIEGYKVLIQKVTKDLLDLPIKNEIINETSSSSESFVDVLQESASTASILLTSSTPGGEMKLPELSGSLLTRTNSISSSKYTHETPVPVKHGTFRMPDDEDGLFHVKVLSNAEPPIILSEHVIKVAEGSVETTAKILDTKASGVETAFWDKDEPLAAATVTGNFIPQGGSIEHKLHYNTSADGSCIIPLPAGMITNVLASKGGKVIISKKDPVQVPPPAILQKPTELRECIQNEVSTQATTMAGCLRHLKTRGVQRLIVLGDRSGSMTGKRFDCLKKSLHDVLEFCRKEKKLFNIGLWDSNTEWIRESSWINVHENPNEYQEVQNWFNHVGIGGSTELQQALESTITKFPTVSDIWTITDGEGIWSAANESWTSYISSSRFSKVIFHFTALGGEVDALELEKLRNTSSNSKGFFSVVNGNNSDAEIINNNLLPIPQVPSSPSSVPFPPIPPLPIKSTPRRLIGRNNDEEDKISEAPDDVEDFEKEKEEEEEIRKEEAAPTPDDEDEDEDDADSEDSDDIDEEKVRKWLKKHQRLKKLLSIDPIVPSNSINNITTNHNKVLALSLPSGKKTHCFLSHNWANGQHEKVHTINQALKQRGFITWFDEEQMDDSIRHKMTEGLSQTACMIIFITKMYEAKINLGNQEDNCFFEFDFASCKISGLTNYRIAAVTELEMISSNNWKVGRLAAELGHHLTVNMTINMDENLELFEKQIDELAKRINQKISKRLSVPN